MLRQVRGASSRVVARVVGSRFAKPIARVALAAAGLLLLAFIGKTAGAGAMGGASGPLAPRPPQAQAADAAHGSRVRASPEDPVILNTATVDDFRRLPGVGEKRATAAL